MAHEEKDGHVDVKPSSLGIGTLMAAAWMYHRVKKKWCWMRRVRRKYTTPSAAMATRFFPMRSHWNGFGEFFSPEDRDHRKATGIKPTLLP